MAEVAAAGVNIFVYMGGEQEVPRNVTHVIIDRSVKIIPRLAFYYRTNLVSVKTHDGIEKIEKGAFNGCLSLRGIKLLGVKIVETGAFYGCARLTDLEFGVQLETIEQDAFAGCPLLRRVAIPLKDNIFPLCTVLQRCTQLDDCDNLAAVDLVGGIHNTIASLLIESWRNEMNQEIESINQVLENTGATETTDAIRLWIESVIDRIEHYKAEHNTLLKEDMTQLELAVWKAKLDEKEQDKSILKVPAKKAKFDVEGMRKEKRITSGASIVIKNVLPFLQLG